MPVIDRSLSDCRYEQQSSVEFFTLLSLCHTVVPERLADGGLKYQAESPDEEALVAGAAAMGYVFTEQSVRVDVAGTTTERYHIEIGAGREEVYDKLAVNEFTSTRKRMSAVFKTSEGRCVVYAKGADMMMELDCGVTIPDDAKEHMQVCLPSVLCLLPPLGLFCILCLSLSLR